MYVNKFIEHTKYKSLICYFLFSKLNASIAQKKAKKGLRLGRTWSHSIKIILRKLVIQRKVEDVFEIKDGKMGIRPLNEIHERCNVAFSDLTRVKEVFDKKEWRVAMKSKMKMMNKNATWSLVTRKKKKYVIWVK